MDEERDSGDPPGPDERERRATSRRLEEVGDRLRQMRRERDAAVEETERAGVSVRDRRDRVLGREEPKDEGEAEPDVPAPEPGDPTED